MFFEGTILEVWILKSGTCQIITDVPETEMNLYISSFAQIWL